MSSGGSQSSQWSQWYEEIQAGRAFIAGLNFTPGGASRGYQQLYNPAGSGVILSLFRLTVSTDTDDLLSFGYTNEAFTNIQLRGSNLGSLLDFSTGEIRTRNGLPAAPVQLFEIRVLNSQPVKAVDDWSVQIPAGYGFHVGRNLVGGNLAAVFAWTEQIA
jgi:hypothetical protein